MNRTDGPTALILTRQGVPVPEVAPDRALVARGGYVRRAGDDAVLVATGSELGIAEAAAVILAGDRPLDPSREPALWEVFAEQAVDYQR